MPPTSSRAEAPPFAPGTNSGSNGFAYVAHDIKRLALLSGGFTLALLLLWYAVNYAGLDGIYSLITP